MDTPEQQKYKENPLVAESGGMSCGNYRDDYKRKCSKVGGIICSNFSQDGILIKP